MTIPVLDTVFIFDEVAGPDNARHRLLEKSDLARQSGVGQESSSAFAEMPLGVIQPGVLVRDAQSGKIFVDILVLPGFDLHDLSVLMDAFHLNNDIRQREEIIICILGATTDPVPSSLKTIVRPAGSFTEIGTGTNVIILAGMEPSVSETPRFRHWVWQCLRRSATLSGVGGGCRVLADAQVLRGRMAVAHWEQCAVLRELHRDTHFLDCLLFTDGRVTTCGGRSTTLDFALHCLDRACGNEIARQVADRLNCHRFRPLDRRQIGCSDLGIRRLPVSIRRALEIIHDNIEEPVSSNDLARLSDICPRQLQRLFLRHFRMTPIRFYQNHRLRCARQFIRHTSLSVTEIALATGFKTASHFSKSYRQFFGLRPSKERRYSRKII